LEKALKKIGTDRLILKQVKRGKNTYVEAFNKMCTSRPLLRQGTNYLEKPVCAEMPKNVYLFYTHLMSHLSASPLFLLWVMPV
jgi:hypothetical protein